ncbi:MAG: periplasmic heavy metal sensor [Bryobacteraceae bacterium]
MKRKLQIALLAAVSICAVQAQPPIPWWENPVASGLTLSEAQKESVNRILGEYRDRLTAEHQDAERAEHEFERVVNADTLEYGRGWKAIDQLVNARAVFTKDMSEMILRLRNVLTAEQWRTVREREEVRGGREGKGRRSEDHGPEGRGRRSGAQNGSAPAH